jgi:hypothetical protein
MALVLRLARPQVGLCWCALRTRASQSDRRWLASPANSYTTQGGRNLKPSVLVNILCGRERDGWVNPQLVNRLFEAISDGMDCGRPLGVNLTQGVTPVEKARNQIVTEFLRSSYAWLLMIDCDIVPPPHFLSLIDASDGEGKFIVGVPCPIIGDAGLTWNVANKKDDLHSNFYNALPAGWTRCDHLGVGFLAVRRCVLETVKSNWFDRTPTMGEDLAFCERAKGAGFSIWFHGAFQCDHLHSMSLLDAIRAKQRATAP